MADDNNNRLFRGSDAPGRGPSGPAAGSDPLAELARLIGQNDPFGEFGRDAGRRAAAPPPVQSAPLAPASQHGPAPFGSPDYARPSYGSAPLAAPNDLYHVESEPHAYDAHGQYTQNYGVPGYAPPGYPADSAAAGYQDDGHAPGEYDQNQPGIDDEYYDEPEPHRRRIGILAIAGIFALAVIGTAGAFGYRAIFGSSSVSAPPPVIKAETAPSKIVPVAADKDAGANKLITERVNERGQERLVSREEQPVAVGSGIGSGSGVVGADPKKIRTITIHPDQQGAAATAPVPQAQPETPEPSAPPPRVTTITPRVTPPPPPPATAARAAVPEPAVARPAPAPVRAAPAPVAAPAPAPANAPLSLNPNAVASAPARAAPPPRVAAPGAASAASGGYAVQISAQRSEAEADAAFRSLQGKFPGQLGNRQPLIKRVDLGAKGIYFRAMVGPFGSSGEASEMCSALKAAGGQCIVQRN